MAGRLDLKMEGGAGGADGAVKQPSADPCNKDGDALTVSGLGVYGGDAGLGGPTAPPPAEYFPAYPPRGSSAAEAAMGLAAFGDSTSRPW